MVQHLKLPFLAIKAGALYYLLIFGLGFILGVFRNLILIPHTGELIAVLLELPFMLTASFLLSGYLLRRFQLHSKKASWIMGGTGFALLMLSEILLGVAFGQTFQATLAGFLGLLGQCFFGILPRIRIGKLK